MSESQARPSREGPLLQLVYYLYVWGSALARALPERLAYGIANVLGGLQARLSKSKRRIVARNLSRITGEPETSERVEQLVVDAYRSYARYWLETFRLARETQEFFRSRFHCLYEERIDRVRERGKGALLVVGHLGNWDAAGAWAGATGRSVVTVAEVLRPRRLFDFFVSHRARIGITIHPAESGVTAKLVEAVEEGAVVAILGDRDLKGRGPEVDFFGARTTFPAGPAYVALQTGVPIMVAGVWGVRRADGTRGWEAEISEPIEVPSERGPDALQEMTQQVASVLEGMIARRPEEWHVFQPFWSEDRAAS